ncbi:MAG: hypothetical protein KDA87_01500 [Planctomycetales bacterium]|nr:hypothetical protein [Planctomycetales bacterium]
MNNPYSSPQTDLISSEAARQQESPSRRLWLAFALAPPISTFVMGIGLGLFGFVYQTLNPMDVDSNPMAIFLVPAFMIVLGTPFCYLVLGVIGMPIIFHQQKRGKLNGASVATTALGIGLLPVILLSLIGLIRSVVMSDSSQAGSYLGIGLILSLTSLPLALIAAAVFWRVGVRRSRI